MWQHTQDDGSVIHIQTPRTIVHAEVQHPADIFQKWTHAELAMLGIVWVPDVEAVETLTMVTYPAETMVESVPRSMQPVQVATAQAEMAAQMAEMQRQLDLIKSAPAPVQPMAAIPPVQPGISMADVLGQLELINEAKGYTAGADPAMFPMMAKRAYDTGVNLSDIQASVIDELAAVKTAG